MPHVWGQNFHFPVWLAESHIWKYHNKPSHVYSSYALREMVLALILNEVNHGIHTKNSYKEMWLWYQQWTRCPKTLLPWIHAGCSISLFHKTCTPSSATISCKIKKNPSFLILTLLTLLPCKTALFYKAVVVTLRCMPAFLQKTD